MKTKQNIGSEFYQNLGKLFYAIAAADKVVRKSEYDSLKKIVKTEWLKFEDTTDDFGVDAAYQIEVVFDWLDYQESTAESCFTAFNNFFNENKSLFTDNAKQLIWNTVNNIASAFSGKNKSELILLGRLQLLFEK